MAVAGMILVNNPGSWTDGYSMLIHADWNGCTLADLIFPTFLFIVGIAITISFGEKLRCGENESRRVAQILRRAAVLVGLGLVLNGFPAVTLTSLRFPGVLQRIGVCYACAALLGLRVGTKGQGAVAVLLIVLYGLLIKLVPVPGYGPGSLTPEANLPGYVDDWLLRGHLYHESFDPEGLLSTLPAISTTLFGMLSGRWLRAVSDARRSAAGLLAVGVAGIAGGLLIDPWFPINKQLWSPSFAVFTAGIAALLLAACRWLVDVHGHRSWAKPFVVLGSNAIAVYVLSSMVARLMELVPIHSADGLAAGLRAYVFERFLSPWAGPLNGSLVFASGYLLLWIMLMNPLHKRGVFIRI